jgi:hypothetical protein
LHARNANRFPRAEIVARGKQRSVALMVKKTKGEKSNLEVLLAFQMRAAGLPEFEREYVFHPDRKWRFDFYRDGWGIEINGGGWNQGGHNRNPIVMGRDYEKYNAAMEMGIKVLLYTGEQIKDLTALAQLERIFK